MEIIDPVTAQRAPKPLWRFATESCGLAANAIQMLRGSDLPEPARRLLVHHYDMTSMLAAYHASTLRVKVLKAQQLEDTYYREVFLRGDEIDRVVEYGIIAIRLDPFTGSQQKAIRAGRTPLGGLLHQFKLPFVSHPIGFFSITTDGMDATRRVALGGAVCLGRFNQLSRPTGEPLAWIMEVLPCA